MKSPACVPPARLFSFPGKQSS